MDALVPLAVKLAVNRSQRSCEPIASTLIQASGQQMEESVLRGIKSGLFVIERCLRDILQETRTSPESKNWLLKVRHSDIDDDVANRLIIMVEGMLREIQELQKAFNIEKNPESVRWHVINSLNEISTILSDLTPDRLLGFGQMQAEVSQVLTTHVDRMHTIAENMQRMLTP